MHARDEQWIFLKDKLTSIYLLERFIASQETTDDYTIMTDQSAKTSLIISCLIVIFSSYGLL